LLEIRRKLSYLDQEKSGASAEDFRKLQNELADLHRDEAPGSDEDEAESRARFLKQCSVPELATPDLS
jgi:hypothetical protein